MTLKEKQLHKRKAKLYLTFAYLTIPFAFTFLAGTIIARNHIEGEWSTLIAALLLCGFLLPLIIGLALGMHAQTHVSALRRYMAAIQDYRQNKFFVQSLNALQANDFDTAIHIYDNLINNNYFKRFLFGLVTGMALYSDDGKRAERAFKKLETLKKTYNPDNIIF